VSLPTVDDVRPFRLRAVESRGALLESVGVLVPIEGGNDLPFPIARVFVVYGVPSGEVRGDHAHRACEQVLVCLRGRCLVTCDDGTRTVEHVLDAPTSALHVPATIWASERYDMPGTLLMVFADRVYDETDYFRRREDFLAFRRSAS